MAFIPRNFEQILADMVSHVRANTTLTDFTVGSVIRTILEAAALEDDEQYFQMVQLLDAFRIQTAAGADLDERAADLNLTRLPASTSSGTVVFQNGGLTTGELLFNATSGAAVTLSLSDTSDFPAAPFIARLGEGTPQVEDVSITNNNTTANTLTAATVAGNHSAGARVSLTGGGNKVISSGIQVQVPAGGGVTAVPFMTIDAAIVPDGNFESGPVRIRSTVTGVRTNVAVGRISQFQGSPPFVGALVTNKVATQGGRSIETDVDFRSRLIRRIGELSKGTPFSIESSVIGIEDPDSGQRVVSSTLREDFLNDRNHILYIDDGTGFVPTRVNMAESTLSSLASIGATQLDLNDVEDFPDGGSILVGPGTASPELLTYSSKGPGLQLNLDSATLSAHAASDEVLLVDDLGAAETGQNFFQISDFPLVENTLQLYDSSSGSFVERVENTDFVANRTNGEIQYSGAGLPSGARVLAHYSYFTGLVQLVQKTITGDPNDRINFPGVAAGGIIINVDTPVIRRISVTISISAESGFDESELRNSVQREIEAYIDGLKIDDNVFRARIIERAMQIPGIRNVVLQVPTSDIVILENELPVSFDSSGNSLVTVL